MIKRIPLEKKKIARREKVSAEAIKHNERRTRKRKRGLEKKNRRSRN
jgi:hypothetical protein